MLRNIVLVLILLVPAVASCGNQNGNDNENINDNNGNQNHNDNGYTPPSDFAQAGIVSFNDDNSLLIEADISETGEVDVYDMGRLSAGDKLSATCQPAESSRLDPLIALFDAEGFRVFWNDDIDAAHFDYNAGFDDFIRHGSEHYFLAVTHTDYGGNNKTGDYECTLQLQPQAGLAAIAGQTVVLNWSAAEQVTVSGNDYGDLPAFDAQNINPMFSDDTVELQNQIVQLVQDDFDAFEVAILTSNDQPTGDFTTVYYAVSTSASIFGLADDIDFYNQVQTDNVILFLEAFDGLTVNLDNVAQALANVTSHEIGHTLGLMHNSNIETLMDTTGENYVLLDDQAFGIGDVVDFPIGQQNSIILLDDTVGPRSSTAKLKLTALNDGKWRCGTCGAVFDAARRTWTPAESE